MPLQLQTTHTPYWWPLPGYEDEEHPPEFRLAPLNGEQSSELTNSLAFETDDSLKIEERSVKIALKYGLRDWKNIVDENGNNLEFHRGNIRYLPFEVRSKIFVEILKRNQLSEQERKNS